MGRFDFLNDELNRLRREGLYNNIRTIESPQGAWIQIDGRRVLNLCSNNYLGLASDPRLRERAARALEQWGVGPGAVRIIAGTTRLHLELEEKLAAFKHRQSAVLFGSGLLANQGVIPAIADAPEDAIFTDELNHASIIDGCRLSRAARQIYRHLDLDDLRAKLGAASGARRRLIITDGVFSMDGDIAPLPDLVAVAREHDALLMVDDAHGDGVLGSHGRGIVDHFGLRDEVDIEVGTLSKAFGVIGGFAAGAAPLAEYLKQKSRAFTFTSALTAVDVAACLAGLDLLSEDDARVRRLWDNAAHFKAGLTRAGFDVGASRTPITPVMLGEAETAQAFSQRLYERGIFATSIGFPIVARGRARIRCMVSAAHETTDLDLAVEAFAQVGRELAVLA